MSLVSGDQVSDQNGNVWTVWGITHVETDFGEIESRALVYQCTGGAVSVYRVDDQKKRDGDG